MLRRRLIRTLFALFLLLGQASAFAHALGHLQPHDSGLPEPVCEVCLAHANLGSVAPASAFTLPVVPGHYLGLPAVPPPPAAVLPCRAQARAPPAPV
ncbi:hypothetical protein [Thiobacillus sp.]|uniref:hypothetical protein n=1 Tax=Thiobacillus sp. TaxID=924 RepID=UPI0025ED8451|nr:hypothetical protein [Thiobacillus sp.]